MIILIQIRPVAELTDDIELNLDEADYIAETTEIRYTHDEVFSRAKGDLDE